MPRPRYSLLALLLFTAAVGGGVKLWRGPHRAVMSDPPTAAEQVILDRATMAAVHAEYFKPLRYEYDFVRTWHGPDCSTVTGRALSSAPIMVLPTGEHSVYELVPENFNRRVPTPTPSKVHESLICWVHSGQLLTAANAPSLTTTAGQVSLGKHLTYYVSSRRRLFTDSPIFKHGIYVKEIELSVVTDPKVRAQIAEELASIPTQQ